MIYKLTFTDGRIDFITAKNPLHLLKSYDDDFDLLLKDVEDLQEVTEEEAKTIIVKNTEYDENDPDDVETMMLWALASGDDFCIISSSEYE